MVRSSTFSSEYDNFTLSFGVSVFYKCLLTQGYHPLFMPWAVNATLENTKYTQKQREAKE